MQEGNQKMLLVQGVFFFLPHKMKEEKKDGEMSPVFLLLF